MGNNAHLNVEIVLNGEEDENEEEKRFNEIICYDSGVDGDSSNENYGNDTAELFGNKTDIPNYQRNVVNDNHTESTPNEKVITKSNAAQMRKYRARQRSDPIRYQQYLHRERVRNYKRKYEKRIRAAQERAQSLGIPYIVLEPPRRGRKPFFDEGISLVLPSKYDDEIEDDWFNSNDMPLEVELQESDEMYKEQKPNISAVNINNLNNHPRSALQTLLPQEVIDRQRVSNFVKFDHDYVKESTKTLSLPGIGSKVEKRLGGKSQKDEKKELITIRGNLGSVKPRRRHRPRKLPDKDARNNHIEHENLDDLFKELAEIANKKPPKREHSSSHKKSPRKQYFLNHLQAENVGEFSLAVSMPVKPIPAPYFEATNIKREPESPTIESEIEYNKSVMSAYNFFTCNEDSIEIKQEPINSEDDFS